MKKHLLMVLICAFILVGCGGGKSTDMDIAQEAVNTYESYKDGKTTEDDAMAKILAISAQIEDQELSMLVGNVVKDVAFSKQTDFITEDPDDAIQEIKDYIEKNK